MPLSDLPELVGFFSYSRDDDDDSHGSLSRLRDRIQRELRGQLGRSRTTLRLWQDANAIAHGAMWEKEIASAISQAVFFVPIVTPTAVNSRHCKFEFAAFLKREAELGRADLVFPILYIRVPELQHERHWRGDEILEIIAARQYLDLHALRHVDIHSTQVATVIETFCGHICRALRRAGGGGGSDGEPSAERTPPAGGRPRAPSAAAPGLDVQFSAASMKDCRALKVRPDSVRSFLADELVRHPIIFDRPFSSFPLVFLDRLICLSWDGRRALVERLLQRHEDASLERWVQCLTVYRRAGGMPYRSLGRDALHRPQEMARTVEVYRRLLSSVRAFLEPGGAGAGRDHVLLPFLVDLFEDAGFALDNGNIPEAMAQLEALLSSVHKLLLHHAPQPRELKEAEQAIEDATVLVIEDEAAIRMLIEDMLWDLGVSAHIVTNAEHALKALVDKKFAIFCVDLNLGRGGGDIMGGELIRLTKRIDPEIKILVSTGYGPNGIASDVRPLVDACLHKPFSQHHLADTIARLLAGERIPLDIADPDVGDASGGRA